MSVPPALRLTAAARTAPDMPAIVAGPGTVTYGELAGAAVRWRERLADFVPPEPAGVVAVVATRTVQCVAQAWGIWESPHTALLLDPRSPVATDEEQLAAWGVRLVLDGERITPIDGARTTVVEGHHTWILTSGSTGNPRPVILTGGNVAAAVGASQRRLGNDAADRWQLALPLFHVGGASVLWRSVAAGGAVVLDERFDAGRTARRLAGGAITISSLVPTMLHRLVPEIQDVSDGVKAILLGGAAAPRSLIERGLAAGLPILTTYGMTETASQVATVAPGRTEDSLHGVGEILVDGPAVSPGYAHEAPRAGPHRTGDRGRFDAAGRLVVAGRTDEMIVTGGENVSPSAVEAILTSHPAVARVIVHGVPDAEWGESVVAVVVAAANTVDASDLDAYARIHLSPAQRPRRWRMAAGLPRLPNGKIDRRAVRIETLATLT